MNQHLTEENLDDLLFGASSAQVYAHLQECEACRLEVTRISEGIASFKKESLAWAERQSMPRLFTQPVRRRNTFLSLPVLLRAAAAAVVVCAGLAGVAHHVEGSHSSSPVAQKRVAQENRVLLAIDQELSAEEPSPRALYGTSSATEQE